MSIDHITYYTPLQDYGGIITPASLHFVQQHSSHLPDIDPQEQAPAQNGPRTARRPSLKKRPKRPSSTASPCAAGRG